MDENIMNENVSENCTELVPEEKEGFFKKSVLKVHGVAKKLGTRNLVIVASVVLIGAAVILNFVMFGNSQPVVVDGDPLGGSIGASDEDDSGTSAYFASAQLSRKQTRDQAIAVLQTVVESASADATSKDQASADISRIVSEMEAEANIETLIKSKGFEECIAVIGEGSASIIVRSDGLLPNELSQIKEIVYEEAGIDPVGIKIIEQAGAWKARKDLPQWEKVAAEG